MELLANYFHIRDYLLEQGNAEGKISFTALAPLPKNAQSMETSVDSRMREMFGDKIHAICLEFENDLKDKVKLVTNSVSRN